MEKEMGMAAILAICVVVLLIGVMKQKAGILVRFIGRAAAGAAAIYLTNQMLLANQSNLAIGMNPVNVITVGLLGIGGYGLLYGIMIYHSL